MAFRCLECRVLLDEALIQPVQHRCDPARLARIEAERAERGCPPIEINVSGVRTEVDYALRQLNRGIHRIDWDAVRRAKDAMERAQELLGPAE
jgi:hypothetical protein